MDDANNDGSIQFCATASSEALFELANAPLVAYRGLRCAQKPLLGSSGGVVWESSYMLAEWLLQKPQSPLQDCGVHLSVLELGAGCGLLGMALAKYGAGIRRVVLTEQAAALHHLQHNVDLNMPLLSGGAGSCEKGRGADDERRGCGRSSGLVDGSCGRKEGRGKRKRLSSHTRQTPVTVHALDWTSPVKDAAALVAGNSGMLFDVLVGTDVLFDIALLDPIVDSAAQLVHPMGVLWLCSTDWCGGGWEIVQTALSKRFRQVTRATEQLLQVVPMSSKVEVELWCCRGGYWPSKGRVAGSESPEVCIASKPQAAKVRCPVKGSSFTMPSAKR